MSGNSGWDVVFPTNYYIRPMREYGLLAELDHDAPHPISTISIRSSAIRNGTPICAGACPTCGTPPASSPTRRSDRCRERWADLWEARWQGKITMLDDPGRRVRRLPEKARPFDQHGEARRNCAPRSGKRSAQKHLLRAYLNAEVRDQLVAGDVWAAQLWSTTAQQAIDAAPHLDFVYPAEGFAIYPDNAVILRESRHQRRGIRLPQLPAAARGRGRHRRRRPDRDRQRSGPCAPARIIRDNRTLYPSPRNHGARRVVAHHVGRHPAAAGPALDRGKVELDAPGCRRRSPGQSGRLGSRALVLFRPRIARTARQDPRQLPAARAPAVVAEPARRRRDQGDRHPRRPAARATRPPCPGN